MNRPDGGTLPSLGRRDSRAFMNHRALLRLCRRQKMSLLPSPCSRRWTIDQTVGNCETRGEETVARS